MRFPRNLFSADLVSKLATCIAVCLAFVPLPALAQLEPCGFFEVDGEPGYGPPDMYYTASFWMQSGSMPAVPDYDGNGLVNVLDMVRQASCVADLSHGLAGRYYGFNDGSDGQSIGFPDFDNLPASHGPAVIRATEMFEVLDGFRAFMDSNMRRQFGAVYEGYLFVPETANYTLHVFANRGARLTLDGNQVITFDGSPNEGTVNLPLSYGLHPVKLEFYVNTNAGRILFDWTSDGTVITGDSKTIQPWYLYHASEVVTGHAQTEMELLFNPPSGTRVNTASATIETFVMGPNSQVRMWRDGQEQVLFDGRHEQTFTLQHGLNAFQIRGEDGDGRILEKTYHIYRDTNPPSSNGLAASFFSTEWYEGMPSVSQLQAWGNDVADGTQLNEVDNVVTVGSTQLHRGTVARLQGVIQVGTSAEYEFRVTGNTGLWINGEFIGGIWATFPGQWQPEGTVTLAAGRHHYRLDVYDPWSGPEAQVYWRINGGGESLVPNGVFRHDSSHFEAVPQSATRGSSSRVSRGLIAEYLFQPGAEFADSSGLGFNLSHDPRAIPRANGGLTYQTGGSLFSEQAGVHAAAKTVKNDALSIEIDFVWDGDTLSWNRTSLAALTEANWGTMAQISIRRDDLMFRLWNNEGGDEQIEAQDVVTPGNRYHVVATFSGETMRLYVNGAVIGSVNWNPNFKAWENLAKFQLGSYYNRRAGISTNDYRLKGSLMTAAVYDRALTHAEVQQNQNANLTISPTPGPLPAPAVTAFPPGGTSAAQLDEAFHILNRLSFGPSPDSLEEVLNMGVTNWINNQLNPQAINDSEFEAIFNSGYFIPEGYENDFQAATLFRMAASKRQLLEVITQFWENHFNTQFQKSGNLKEELAENNRFREMALGNFGDLLKASAMNYPMTVYLDNVSNVVGAPNENYAREVFELFGLGVNNGYTQEDIVEAARCFTGWTVSEGKFLFDPGFHDFGEKNLLGMTIPAGGGLSDAMTVIEHVVGMTECSEFITWKLCQYLIDDDPPADVTAAAAATFRNTNGDITQVLQTILNHARFRTDTAYRANKVKTPLEFVTSTARTIESFPLTISLNQYLRDMGMNLFNYPEPTGFAEEGVAWIDTNSLLVRWNLVNNLTANRGEGMNTGINMENYIAKRGLSTSNEILDFFESVTTHGLEPAGVRAIAENWLTGGSPGSFVLNEGVLDNEVRQTLGLYLRLAEFNKQ